MSIENAKRIVIKVGSSLIVDQKGSGLREKWLKSLIDDVVALKKRGKEVIIVTSGSVALGKKYIKYGKNGLKLEEKQAAAACGQTELVRHYQKFLNEHGIQAAQILLTIFDSESRRNYLNAKSTLEVLLANNIVPVINENDTVATHELRFGDNDRLAARVAQMSGSGLLILFSDVDGLYTANPRLDSDAMHINEVKAITEEIEAMGGEAITTGVGSGGMITKIAAAKIAMSSGCDVILTLGTNLNPIKTLEEGGKHTLFISQENSINARKRWIASSLNIAGVIVVDNGAVRALRAGNSLLPAGVVDIKGVFKRGDTVEIKDCSLKKVGLGISAYSSRDAKMIMGHKSQDIENLVGFSGRNELIHRDNMVVESEAAVAKES
jgi:glutamate 5-kinase